MKKSQLAFQVKQGITGDGMKALLSLIDALVKEGHEANESNRGDDFLVTQGKIQNCRELTDILNKKEKKS